MKSCRGNADVLIVIILFVCVLIGIWIYQQIKAFSAWAGVDMDSAKSVFSYGVALIGVIFAAVWFQLISKIWTYIPAAVFLVFTPVLNYKAVEHIGNIVLSNEIQWFGTWWAQFGITAALVAIGYLLSKHFD